MRIQSLSSMVQTTSQEGVSVLMISNCLSVSKGKEFITDAIRTNQAARKATQVSTTLCSSYRTLAHLSSGLQSSGIAYPSASHKDYNLSTVSFGLLSIADPSASQERILTRFSVQTQPFLASFFTTLPPLPMFNCLCCIILMMASLIIFVHNTVFVPLTALSLDNYKIHEGGSIFATSHLVKSVFAEVLTPDQIVGHLSEFSKQASQPVLTCCGCSYQNGGYKQNQPKSFWSQCWSHPGWQLVATELVTRLLRDCGQFWAKKQEIRQLSTGQNADSMPSQSRLVVTKELNLRQFLLRKAALAILRTGSSWQRGLHPSRF